MYRLELRKNGGILKLNTQRMPPKTKKNNHKTKALCVGMILLIHVILWLVDLR